MNINNNVETPVHTTGYMRVAPMPCPHCGHTAALTYPSPHNVMWEFLPPATGGLVRFATNRTIAPVMTVVVPT